MMRQLPNGKKRFCYGMFVAAVVVSGLIGAFVAHSLGAEWNDRASMWLAAMVGANLAPLFVDAFYRSLRAQVLDPRRHQ